jgi:UPF0271 protein
MPLIDMANIACGGHIGDDESMINAIKLALKNNVKIGVHPSYKDTQNFGRLSHNLADNELFDLIYYQVSHFKNLCLQNGATLEYIKPHGALYHDMNCQQSVLNIICKVIKSVDPKLFLVVQAGNETYLKKIKNNQNIRFLREVFADRAYNGMQIIPRNEQNSVLNNANDIVKQYWQFTQEKSFKIDTICFHSDNKASVKALIKLKKCIK